MTITEALHKATARLYDYLHDPIGAAQEARWLLAHALTIPMAQLIALTRPLTATELSAYEELLSARIHDEKPLAYILGSVPFCGLLLSVEPPILIPRHETEELVTVLIEQLKPYAGLRILDLCSGSGAIALALAKHLPSATVIGVDISQQALTLANKNKTISSLSNVSFVLSNLFTALETSEPFDVIISNPPYIPLTEWEALPNTVKKWESSIALVGGDPDGLALYRAIIEQAPHFLSGRLRINGCLELIFEHGANQQEALSALAIAQGFGHSVLWRDTFGKARALFCSYTPQDR